MTCLLDRMRSETLQPVNLHDLLSASKRINGDQWFKGVNHQNIGQDAKNIRPLGRGLNPAFYDQAMVVNADNVVRYVQENTNGTEYGTGMMLLDDEVLDLFGQTSAIAVLPPYSVMFLEAKAGENLMGISSFGWTVVRVDREEGGWEMQASLVVEWTKGRPVGPLYTLMWTLDEQGRYVRETHSGQPHPSLPDLNVAYPTDPRRSDPDLLERLCEPYLRGFNGAIATLALTLGFMNCKNVAEIEHVPPTRLARAHRKRRGQPLTRFTTLDIRPMSRALERSGGTKGGGLGKAMHTCRGHFKTYKPESPLFGRLAGQFWWEEHERGHTENGRVIKDYRQHPPRDLNKVGDVYRHAAAGQGTSDGVPSPLLAHQRLQDELADLLIEQRVIVLSPAPHEPQFDLGCEGSDGLWLIEVKTTTPANEVHQIRSAIGQVLHYREIMREMTEKPIHCAIAVGAQPQDKALERTCASQGIKLTWPDDFDAFANKLA